MAKTFSEAYYGKNFTKKKPQDQSGDAQNREFINFSIEGFQLPPIDVGDIQQVVDRCSFYFQRCGEDGIRPGVANMCVWLGISRTRWQKWCAGAEFKHTHMVACQKINSIFDAQMESYMQNGKINPVSGIFLMKNNLGYTDAAEKPVEQKNSAIQEIGMEDVLKLATTSSAKKK